MRTTAKIEITATAIDAIHHGAGTSGNTSLLRTQEVIRPDGTLVKTPFISGNSLRHMIREHGARHAVEVMGVEDGSLTKPVTDLLFSGGHLSKTGAEVNLAKARKLEGLFPILGLCGYSAGNVLTTSKMRVDNLHLACEENAWRMPARVADLPPAQKRVGLLRGEEFGTRHEASRRPHVARMLTPAEGERLALAAAKNAEVDYAEKGDSSQMIYDFQTVIAGSVWWGALHLDDVTEFEMAALKAALSHACDGHEEAGYIFRVGAKNNQGWGRVAFQFSGQVRQVVQSPTYEESESLTRIGESGNAELDRYTSHLTEHRDEILAALQEAVS